MKPNNHELKELSATLRQSGLTPETRDRIRRLHEKTVLPHGNPRASMNRSQTVPKERRGDYESAQSSRERMIERQSPAYTASADSAYKRMIERQSLQGINPLNLPPEKK